MAKDNEVELEENEDVETDEVKETSKVVRPKELADELGINPKSLRGFLRENFPRHPDEKNTSWELTAEMIKSATEHFVPSDDEELEEDEDAELEELTL